MSGPLILAVVAAVAFVGYGLNVLAGHYHDAPTDLRRPGPLFFSRLERSDTAHSTELRRLVSVVSNAILNDRSAGNELQQVFDQLGAPGVLTDDADSTNRRDRQRRSEAIEQAVADLERRHREPQPSPSERRRPR
jgi:hypothetical protein